MRGTRELETRVAAHKNKRQEGLYRKSGDRCGGEGELGTRVPFI